MKKEQSLQNQYKGRTSHIFDYLSTSKLMESTLRIKNFGPIKDVSLELKNVNVFIGPQASGKSTIAKLFTILKAPRYFFLKEFSGVSAESKATETFVEVLNNYNIGSFLTEETELEYESELHGVTFKNSLLEYRPYLLLKINNLKALLEDFDKNKEAIAKTLGLLSGKYIHFAIRAESILIENKNERPKGINRKMFDRVTQDQLPRMIGILEEIETGLSTNPVTYIPAERYFSNIIKKFALNFMINKVPISPHLLSFGAYLETIDPNDIDLSFIQDGIKYINVDGEDKISLGEKEILLSEAASGIQSVIPILSAILHSRLSELHNSFVIEEPELNLSPLAQYRLIQLLESKRDQYHLWEDAGTIHTYTTHSPYILSCLNNLLYADKVKKAIFSKRFNEDSDYETAKKNSKDIVGQIIKGSIPADYFSAYQVQNGSATAIFNREIGLIEDNYIDDGSDEINDDFDRLMELEQ